MKRIELPVRDLPLIAGAALLSVVGYQLASRMALGPGFPLDDAWIHQTYARSLAELGQWAYWPGDPSGGSTSPLWTALLAAGRRLGIEARLWAYLLGWVALTGIGLTGMRLLRAWQPAAPRAARWAGLFLVFEWHLAWAAGSGMETLMMGWLALLALAWLCEEPLQPFRIGLLVGAALWVRPDGLTLVGPALWVLLLRPGPLTARARAAIRFALGTLLPGLPYLLFNVLLTGTPWPNTFFAKQAEYAVLRELPLLQRLGGMYSLPLIGAGVLLLPGLALLGVSAWQRRDQRIAAALLWLAGYIGLYALRLPVTYQYGRYIIPAMPVYFVAGLAGLAGWLRLDSSFALRRITGRMLALSLALLCAAFWGVGANAYARDVAIIESEMVAAARWVAANTPPDALVAAHDIGALGYFGGRRLVDLAGLVSPEVVPFIRDEAALAAYLDRRQVEYLVT
ncbi:MAG: hypothetical protein ACKOC5_04165, partial [Chloroflexota bacterium]